jgi:hypothetical protein
MIYQTCCLQDKCKMCLKIDSKQRRKAKHIENYNRWRHEPRRYQDSITKTIQDIKELDEAIAAIMTDKHDRYMKTRKLPPPVLADVVNLQPAVAEATEPSSVEQHGHDDTSTTITDGDTITILLELSGSGSAHPDGQGGTV